MLTKFQTNHILFGGQVGLHGFISLGHVKEYLHCSTAPDGTVLRLLRCFPDEIAHTRLVFRARRFHELGKALHELSSWTTAKMLFTSGCCELGINVRHGL